MKKEKDLELDFIKSCKKVNKLVDEKIDLIKSILKEIESISEQNKVPVNFELLDIGFNYTPSSFNENNFYDYDIEEYTSKIVYNNCYEYNLPKSIGWNSSS